VETNLPASKNQHVLIVSTRSSFLKLARLAVLMLRRPVQLHYIHTRSNTVCRFQLMATSLSANHKSSDNNTLHTEPRAARLLHRNVVRRGPVNRVVIPLEIQVFSCNLETNFINCHPFPFSQMEYSVLCFTNYWFLHPPSSKALYQRFHLSTLLYIGAT